MGLRPALYNPSDLTTGHQCWPPVGYLPPPLGASPNVLMNSSLVHKVGDSTIIHSCPTIPFIPHPDIISTGFPTVLVNGTPVALQGTSVLTSLGVPTGIVAGLATTNVICGAGSLNTPNRIANFKVP